MDRLDGDGDRGTARVCCSSSSRFQLFVRDCRAVRVKPSEIGLTSRDEDDYRWDSALALAAAGTWWLMMRWAQFQNMSTIQSYIKRFREAPPTSREER